MTTLEESGATEAEAKLLRMWSAHCAEVEAWFLRDLEMDAREEAVRKELLRANAREAAFMAARWRA